MEKSSNIFHELSDDATSELLKACGLPMKLEYNEDEVYLLRQCQSLIKAGKTYQEAALLLQQSGSDSSQNTDSQLHNIKQSIVEPNTRNKSAPTPKKTVPKNIEQSTSKPLSVEAKEEDRETKSADYRTQSAPTSAPEESKNIEQDNIFLSMAEMLARASNQAGNRVTLAETIKALQLCGLPEKDDYTQSECDRFIEICILYRQQDKSKKLSDHLSDAAAVSEDSLLDLVEKITDKRANNIPGMVNQMYLQKVGEKLANSHEDIKSFYAGLEERILEQIEGKSRLRLIMESGEWETISSPLSLEKPMLLPEESGSITNGD